MSRSQAAVPVVSPGVSVVIPTLLRPSLKSAIASVRNQNYAGSVELIVVLDRDRADCSHVDLAAAEGSDVMLFTGGGKGGGRARNLGVAAGSANLVAFLDDDDRWLPSKLSDQIAVYQKRRQISPGSHPVVACRYREESARDCSRQSKIIPGRLIRPDERIEDYLFRSKAPRVDRPSIITSSLVLDRELALRVPWAEDLQRHQDWDWLARLQRDPDVLIVQAEQDGVVYGVGSTGSVSSSDHWRSSLDWVNGWRHSWEPQTYVDFVTAQPLRYAIQARSPRGVIACLIGIAKASRLPGAGPGAMALTGLAPRSLFNRVRLNGGSVR